MPGKPSMVGILSEQGADVEFDPPRYRPASLPYQVKVTVTSDVSGLST